MVSWSILKGFLSSCYLFVMWPVLSESKGGGRRGGG